MERRESRNYMQPPRVFDSVTQEQVAKVLRLPTEETPEVSTLWINVLTGSL
jgi:hypothetical protein